MMEQSSLLSILPNIWDFLKIIFTHTPIVNYKTIHQLNLAQ